MSISKYLTETLQPSCGCCMKLPIMLNESDEDVLNLKKYNLRARFDFWNEKLFDGKLPMVDKIGFASLKSKGATGITNAKVDFVDGSKKTFTSVWDSKIILSSIHKFTQQTLDQILIHEMIHWYFIGVMKVNENHGSGFKQFASKFGKIVGFEIPLVDNITAIEDRIEKLNDVGIIIFDMGSRMNVMFTSKTNFEKKIAELFYGTLRGYTLPNDTKITYGIGKYPKIHEYSQLRSMKKIKWYSFNNDEMQTISWKNGSVKETYFDEI